MPYREALQRKQRRNQNVADTHAMSEWEEVFAVSKFKLPILQKNTLRATEKEDEVQVEESGT